jgi:succinyl-CoA synthetase alpha subunit
VSEPVPVAGPQAFREAVALLRRGRDVLLPGMELSLAEEIALKDEAAARGRLVLGPGAQPGALPPGRFGIVGVGAEATGRVLRLLALAGEGGRVLPVGARDLSAAVCGRSTLQALVALDGDPAVTVVVIAAERPPPEVSELLREAARRLATPVVSAAPGEEEAVLARFGLAARPCSDRHL